MIAKLDDGVGGRPAASTARRGETPTAFFAFGVHQVDGVLDATRKWLLAQQRDDGHWVGELEGDTILESEYVLLLAFLGRETSAEAIKCCKYLYEHQGEDGGWAIYPGGPSELSASVKAYFALKLGGMSPEHPAMLKARRCILDLGGAQACNSFTRFYLALLGQISYQDCPSVPPELMLLPKRFGFSIYAMSSWTRTIVVPLSIISALKPVRPIPDSLGIAELFRPGEPAPSRRTRRLFTWTNFFLAVDQAFKWIDRKAPARWRKPGLDAAHRWMVEHFENSDGLGAIFPPMIYSVIALLSLGYDRESGLVRWALRQLEDLLVDEDGSLHIQPCVSPVWDTAIAAIALADSGVQADDPALLRSARWLLSKEIRGNGDWQVRCRGVEPTGWHFQYRNDFYPDVDDTAMVLLALGRSEMANGESVREATKRGVDWILAMQNRDGGWAAFDRDIDNQILTKVPFADHNAMLDPSCADITARVLELLGNHGYRAEHPAVARALDYLFKSQEPEGCWYGRWGVNYIYGTWQVLLGLRAIDYPMDHPSARRAADWLESVQQSDGGWGESCRSYDDPSWMGRGPTTPTQTAWAIAGLIAAGRAGAPSVRRGVEHLVETQNDDGTWDEDDFTGTGFPRVFYLKYHLYRTYFPLMALGRYRAAVGRAPRISAPSEIPMPQSPGILACGVPADPRPFPV
jgi:squalene-hopene/tetraprenyl-beta-curcumene cyclase